MNNLGLTPNEGFSAVILFMKDYVSNVVLLQFFIFIIKMIFSINIRDQWKISKMYNFIPEQYMDAFFLQK